MSETEKKTAGKPEEKELSMKEIKEMLSNSENQEYLLLAEEPSPDSDTPPMTSLDMSILLGSYCCTLTAYRLGRLWTTGRPVSEND